MKTRRESPKKLEPTAWRLITTNSCLPHLGQTGSVGGAMARPRIIPFLEPISCEKNRRPNCLHIGPKFKRSGYFLASKFRPGRKQADRLVTPESPSWSNASSVPAPNTNPLSERFRRLSRTLAGDDFDQIGYLGLCRVIHEKGDMRATIGASRERQILIGDSHDVANFGIHDERAIDVKLGLD